MSHILLLWITIWFGPPPPAQAAAADTEFLVLGGYRGRRHDADRFYVPDEVQAGTNQRNRGPSERYRRKKGRPWYLPRAALGVGLNVPELVPVEAWLFFGKYFAIRGFYAPQLPFNIRVEMPSDVISTKKGVGVANPDFTINLKAHYGPHYGLEAMVFPFGGSFFIGGGAAHRTMRLVGSAKSSILICSLIEVAKEPPCPDPDARLHPDTKLQVAADARTTALLVRGAIGFFWDVSDWAYFTLQAGATRPSQIRRRVKVTTGLDFPNGDGADDDITGALALVKTEREAELERKAIKEMRPVDSKLLPILGLSTGIRF